jgi:translation initiation factor 1 (eIF-1/SUI1)
MARPKSKIPLIQPTSAPFNNPFAQSLAAPHRSEQQTKSHAEPAEGTGQLAGTNCEVGSGKSAGTSHRAGSSHEARSSHAGGVRSREKPPKQKFHIHHERKGRGGKTVTLIGGLAGSPGYLQDLAKQLRRAMGCGASVEGNTVVLQGDHQERAAAWLAELYKGA